jgi:hypothetical protein
MKSAFSAMIFAKFLQIICGNLVLVCGLIACSDQEENTNTSLIENAACKEMNFLPCRGDPTGTTWIVENICHELTVDFFGEETKNQCPVSTMTLTTNRIEGLLSFKDKEYELRFSSENNYKYFFPKSCLKNINVAFCAALSGPLQNVPSGSYQDKGLVCEASIDTSETYTQRGLYYMKNGTLFSNQADEPYTSNDHCINGDKMLLRDNQKGYKSTWQLRRVKLITARVCCNDGDGCSRKGCENLASSLTGRCQAGRSGKSLHMR